MPSIVGDLDQRRGVVGIDLWALRRGRVVYAMSPTDRLGPDPITGCRGPRNTTLLRSSPSASAAGSSSSMLTPARAAARGEAASPPHELARRRAAVHRAAQPARRPPATTTSAAATPRRAVAQRGLEPSQAGRARPGAGRPKRRSPRAAVQPPTPSQRRASALPPRSDRGTSARARRTRRQRAGSPADVARRTGQRARDDRRLAAPWSVEHPVAQPASAASSLDRHEEAPRARGRRRTGAQRERTTYRYMVQRLEPPTHQSGRTDSSPRSSPSAPTRGASTALSLAAASACGTWCR